MDQHGLSLTLLMFRVATDHPNTAPSSDQTAFVTQLAYTCLDFHLFERRGFLLLHFTNTLRRNGQAGSGLEAFLKR